VAESQNIEWKESWRDEYLKWICGFANAQGGKIYIGTNDKGNVIGIQDSKKLLEDIPNKVRDVLGILVDVNLLEKDGRDYIEICVNANSYPVNYKGEYHYRSGSTKQQLKGQALNQFLLQKTGITWDSVPVRDIIVQDLRNDSFDIFREQAVLSKRMDSLKEPPFYFSIITRKNGYQELILRLATLNRILNLGIRMKYMVL
jgi:ATP-dependent DNA helicase RecG